MIQVQVGALPGHGRGSGIPQATPAIGMGEFPPEQAAAPEERLSALEWLVVAVARKDTLASLEQPGAIAAALGAWFGTRSSTLADPHLEALRRMAVLSWRKGYAVPADEVRRFLAAGFTEGQYETLLASIYAAKREERAAAARYRNEARLRQEPGFARAVLNQHPGSDWARI